MIGTLRTYAAITKTPREIPEGFRVHWTHLRMYYLVSSNSSFTSKDMDFSIRT